MKSQRTTQRVVKTLAPTDRGAIELARRYGDALVCVRHRTDHRGAIRHTTVELIVQSRPIQPRSLKVVGVRVEPHERAMHSMVKAAGGRWDSRKRIWQLPSRVVTILNLRDRVVDASVEEDTHLHAAKCAPNRPITLHRGRAR
jgi:hypothetical protein